MEVYLQEVTGLEPDPTGARYVPAKNPKQKPAYDGRKITAAIEIIAEPMLTHVRPIIYRVPQG